MRRFWRGRRFKEESFLSCGGEELNAEYILWRYAEAIYNTAVYFKNVYEDEWITDPLSREMIADVDKSVVLGSGIIDSPVLGKIPPLSLSGGVKTLMLIDHMPEQIFNASTCGDNCAKWL